MGEMRGPELKIPFFLNAESQSEGSLPIQPTHIATWDSLEPSTSSATPLRRVAFACSDNTIWVTSLPQSSATPSTNESSPALPQLIVPKSGPSRGNRSPTASRLTARSTSNLGRHRTSSSASSILSSISRGPSSALSPPPTSAPLVTLSTTTASADPHLGHDHRKSTSVLDHLREQRGSDLTPEDGRLGLGIAGIGRRGLPGIHSKDDISQNDGSTSPRSSKSAESSRTISTRLMGWIGDEKVGEREKKDFAERMQEVEVEREMLREVEEDRRESETEKIIERARKSPLGTPKAGSEAGREGRTAARTKRIILGDAERGKIVQLKVDDDAGILMVLRDIGILDIISLVTLEVVESLDVEQSEPMPKLKHRLQPFWHWRGIHIATHSNEPLILVHGLPWPCALPSPNGEVTRVIMLRRGKTDLLEIVSRLDLPGEGDIGVLTKGTDAYILHSTSSSLISYRVTPPPIASLPSSVQARSSPQLRAVSATIPSHPSTPRSLSPHPDSHPDRIGDSAHLRKTRSTVQLRDAADHPSPTIPEPKERTLGKFLASRLGDKDVKAKVPEVVAGWGIGEGKEIHRDKGISWITMNMRSDGLGLGVGSGGADVFRYNGEDISIEQYIGNPAPGVEFSAGTILDDHKTLLLSSTGGKLVYQCHNPCDGETNKNKWVEVYKTGAGEIMSSGTTHLLIMNSEGLEEVHLRPGGSDERERLIDFRQPKTNREISMITPYDVDTCFVADSAGNISKRKLADLLSGQVSGKEETLSSDRLDARASCMKIIRDDIAYLVAGDEDGIVRVWNAESFELQGSWTLFAFQVQSINLLKSPKFGSLNNCLLCTSQAGTIGIISLIEMEQMYLIPASRVPLRNVYIGGKDVMLAYANGKARVWNFETQEFRRSTGLDAAEDMLNTGDWTMIDIDGSEDSDTALSSRMPTLTIESDLGCLLELDLRKLCDNLQLARSSANTESLDTIRTTLSALIPFDADSEVTKICREGLGITAPVNSISLGQSGSYGSDSFCIHDGADIWRVSAEMTGTLQLLLVTLLRQFLDSPKHEQAAAQLIAYFTASLPEDTISANLRFFAAFYLDPSPDLHQAARILFGCLMDTLSEIEFESLVDAHLPELPSFLPASDQHLEAASLALTMLGGMALHKYQSMTPAALKGIAESIVLYLTSSISSHLALAIELASKGFTTWQAFVDPAELLRRLFFLSTQTPSGTQSPSASHTPATARLAVLHVASTNPALFMSTLSMDILDAKSVDGRKSIMKLCVYMARKKPEVLENSLPKIVEAVVKSLDPNVGKMREDVQQAATVILNELVLAFSTVDFNSATQKLAVGTHEGALIMYDLKTASRLYILEPHKHPVSAVNFSSDGRRLMTVSLEEGCLTVWKVGSSLSGFFNVGGPPRQGGKAGEPFKRIEFARVDNVPLASTSALSDVQISWPGLRQAKVVIKETAMTFET